MTTQTIVEQFRAIERARAIHQFTPRPSHEWIWEIAATVAVMAVIVLGSFL